MKVAAFMPAKGNSNRIANKNVALLDGEPLFLYSLKKLVSVPGIDEVYLDTESDFITELASDVNCRILRRDANLSSNKTDGNQLFMNQVNHCDADIIVQLLCTSPFISEQTIERAVRILKENPQHDSVVAVRKEKLYQWRAGRPCYDINRIPNSVDLEDTIIESMGLYAMRREAALSLKRRIGDNPFLLELTPTESIDVNFPEDFQLAELVASGIRRKERKLFDNIKNLLSSPALSDVLDEFGIKGVLSSRFALNLPEVKVFGRAKTLQIDACQQNEKYEKIYEGLKLYDYIGPGDLIVVANNVPEFAFFGGLNANLAIRSGAAGAIIDGVTRDSFDTVGLDFPVFAKGTYCKDVKKRGVVRSFNKRIRIDGVGIQKDDLIFGDRDGVVVIPKQHEKEVLSRALEVRNSEFLMLSDIARGMHVDELVEKYGFF